MKKKAKGDAEMWRHGSDSGDRRAEAGEPETSAVTLDETRSGGVALISGDKSADCRVRLCGLRSAKVGGCEAWRLGADEEDWEKKG
ncbi:uncharacterized protein DS421_18g606730 [Arachis hypogaea]|nr:uncharacterized protein DS421_18g606730 [Arachis hypogaea]